MRKTCALIITVFLCLGMGGCSSKVSKAEPQPIQSSCLSSLPSSSNDLTISSGSSNVKRFPGDYENTDYSAICIKDIDENDITDTLIDLWYACNEVYNVDDTVMFQMGEPVSLMDSTPDFIELENYSNVVNSIFTRNGIKQLEETKIGGPINFIQKRDNKIYRLGPWKTGYSYAYALKDMKSTKVYKDKIELSVEYQTNNGFYAGEEQRSSRVAEYASSGFTIIKENGIWLVDSYVYPDSHLE